MNILTKTWVGSDEAVLGVPHWLLVVQKLRQIFQKLKKLEQMELKHVLTRHNEDWDRKEDGEAHDEEAGKTGVVDNVEHRDLHWNTKM